MSGIGRIEWPWEGGSWTFKAGCVTPPDSQFGLYQAWILELTPFLFTWVCWPWTLGSAHGFHLLFFAPLVILCFCWLSSDSGYGPWLMLILVPACGCPPTLGWCWLSCMCTGFGFADDSSSCPTLVLVSRKAIVFSVVYYKTTSKLCVYWFTWLNRNSLSL